MNSNANSDQAVWPAGPSIGGEVVLRKVPNPAAPRKAKRNPLFAEVEARVEKAFFADHDRNNPLHRKAYELDVARHRKNIRGKSKYFLVERISLPEVLQAVVDCRVADICDDLAILKRKVAALRLEEAQKRVLVVLGASQGCFLKDDESVDVHRLQVVRKNKAGEVGELKSLLGFCKDVSSGKAPVPVEALCNGEVPKEFASRADFKAFLSDLGELLVNGGSKAGQLVARVCEEVALAREIRDDEDAPKPLRFLASVALKIQDLDFAGKREENKIGFAAG